MNKTAKILLFICSVFLILSVSAIFTVNILLKDTILDETKLKKQSQSIEIYSQSGNLISETSSKNLGKYVKINKINDYTKNAFIAIEDKRFYSHNGIDFKRILGATVENVKTLSFKEGASTITQQLIKNTHLTNEKTLKRKLKEIKLASMIERRYSKDEILELYLNTIYFGQGAYGIEDASNKYFNKSASDLTLNESALLAGIIKAPSTYSPINNYDTAINRKNLVLKVMKNNGFITENEYLLNSNKKIVLSKQNNDYFNDYVSMVINEFENLSIFKPYGYSEIKIQTYLDENLQKSIKDFKSKYDDTKIVINSKINGITAFYGDNSNLKRSPASCVKPWLVYAPMINDKYIKESSVILDENINLGGYSPRNFNDKFNGNVTVKEALSKSLNVPAVKLLNGYGIENANKYTIKMNVNLKNESLPCALGALNNGLTLLDLCNKYSVFNHDGSYVEAKAIKSVSIDGVKIYNHNVDKTEVFSKETAFIINDILKHAVTDGNSKKLRSLPFELCAKTGTNGNENGNLDALSISYTSDSIVGVWMGNINGELMPNSVTGSNEPSYISRQILEQIYKFNKPLPFQKPIDVIEKKIDKNSLILDGEELISENGETFYYIKGSEPKKNLDIKPQIYNVNPTLKNQVITLHFEVKNADYIEIFRLNNNTSTLVYKGDVITNFKDIPNKDGKYNYLIKVYNNNDTIEYKTKSILLDENSLDVTIDDKWLYQ